MPVVLQIGALLCAVGGVLLIVAGYWLRRAVRPAARVDLVDRAMEALVPRGPLIDPAAGLAGMPHGLLHLVAEGQMIPVQVIDGPAPEAPSRGTRMQAAALCRLAEVVYDRSVPYALLRYADRDVPLEWGPALRQELTDLLDEMRRAATAPEVPRSHEDPSICRTCAVRAHCAQALV
jgi:CRISPR/Cas system-associated exonuclease Cas4 (RecB family)